MTAHHPISKTIKSVPLRDLTTFRLGGPAEEIIEATSNSDVINAILLCRQSSKPFFILGGGSNAVISDDGFAGVVISVSTNGVEILEESARTIRVKVAAGETWDSFVARCVEEGWWGVENMSYIPGTVGAVPIQNVGAYGQEVSQVIESVVVWDQLSNQQRSLRNDECCFSYRESVFNRAERDRYVVLSVIFLLQKNGTPKLSHTAVLDSWHNGQKGVVARLRNGLRRRYPVLTSALNRMQRRPDAQEIRECVITLRTDGRLPDPATDGNAGSFFKNVSLAPAQFRRMLNKAGETLDRAQVASLEIYRTKYSSAEGIKLPAAALVRACGLANIEVGKACLYPLNPSIIINRAGSATAKDVMTLMRTIRRDVYFKIGISLQPEPSFVGFCSADLEYYMDLESDNLSRLDADQDLPSSTMLGAG